MLFFWTIQFNSLEELDLFVCLLTVFTRPRLLNQARSFNRDFLKNRLLEMFKDVYR